MERQHRKNIPIPRTSLENIRHLGISRKSIVTNDYKRKKEGRGGGGTKIQIYFQNSNSKRSAKFQGSLDMVAKNSILFLSETMTLDEKQIALLDNKTFDYVSAIPTKGRPSGGLEMYSNPRLKARTLSKSNTHIALKCSNIVIIGVYF